MDEKTVLKLSTAEDMANKFLNLIYWQLNDWKLKTFVKVHIQSIHCFFQFQQFTYTVGPNGVGFNGLNIIFCIVCRHVLKKNKKYQTLKGII